MYNLRYFFLNQKSQVVIAVYIKEDVRHIYGGLIFTSVFELFENSSRWVRAFEMRSSTVKRLRCRRGTVVIEVILVNPYCYHHQWLPCLRPRATTWPRDPSSRSSPEGWTNGPGLQDNDCQFCGPSRCKTFFWNIIFKLSKNSGCCSSQIAYSLIHTLYSPL